MDDALRNSLRKMKNGTGPQIRRLIDDILAGKRTMRNLVATEQFGGRVREAHPNLEAIRREVEKLEKESGAVDGITEKPE